LSDTVIELVRGGGVPIQVRLAEPAAAAHWSAGYDATSNFVGP
jgi:hypothetical protein